MFNMYRLIGLLLGSICFSLVQAAGIGLNGGGITFPDGSIQTTAAGQGHCVEITQADIPFKITVPGVYCLTENIRSGTTAITIDANNVALNLNGYFVDGSSAGSDTSQTGIFCMNQKNPVITNGTITGYLVGIMLNNCDGAEITHIHSVGNYHTGIDMFNGSEGVLIAHNHINNIGGTTRSGYTATSGIITRSNCPGARIIDNDIHNIRSTDSGAARGIYLKSDGGMIINNRISGLRPASGGYQSPIFFVYMGGLIRGNTISGSGTSAISVNSAATSALCADNKAQGFSNAAARCNDGGGNIAFP